MAVTFSFTCLFLSLRNLFLDVVCDPFRKEDILGRTKNPSGMVGRRTSQRPVGGTGKGVGVPGSFLPMLAFASLCRRNGFQHRWVKDFAKDVGRGLLGRRLAFPEPMGCCALAFMILFLRKYGPHGELFFFLTKKDPFALTEAVQFKPFILAETLKACALTGLHLMTGEGEAGPSGCQSPDLGDTWRGRLPKNARIGTATANRGAKVKAFLRPIFRGHHVESLALHVIGLNGSGEKVSLFSRGLGTCEGGI